MKASSKALIYTVLVVLLAPALFGATVTWDGGGGDNSWQNAANWSGDVLPGPNDDVVISGAGEVIYNAGNLTIRSLQSTRTFTMTGGILTLTAGPSAVQGAVNFKAGSMYVRGSGTSFSASGDVSYSGTGVHAEQGASITLAKLVSIVMTSSVNALFVASDAGSRISLPALKQVTMANFYRLHLEADSGARIDLPVLNQIDGAIDAYAADGATIDLSGFQGTIANLSSGGAKIETRSGGGVLIPNVTDLDKVDLVMRGEVETPTAQLHSIRNASLTLDGAVNNFPALTNLANSSVYLEGGAQASLAGVRQLMQTNASDLSLSVADANSVLEFPNLTEATVPNFYQLTLQASAGGVLRLPLLAKLNGALDAFAVDAGSSIVLPALQGSLTNSTSGGSSLEARDKGVISLPGVTGLGRIDLTLRRGGSISSGQLKSFNGAKLTIDGMTGNFPLLTDLDGSSVWVLAGGQISLPGVTKLSRSTVGNITFGAANQGSVLNLPNVTESSVADFYYLELAATGGGQVNLPKLSKVSGAINFHSEGAGSVVNVPALAGTIENSGRGLAYIEAKANGTITMPGVTGLKRINLTQRNAGNVSTAQLTSFVDAEITLEKQAGDFPALTNLTGSSLTLEGNAQLVLAGITELARTNAGNIEFNVSDPGSALSLPNLTRVSLFDFYSLQLQASAGGRIDLPSLSAFNRGLNAFADGAGSIVNLPALSGVLVNGSSGASYLEARNGGTVAISNVTGLERFTMTIRGTGSIPTAQFSSIRNSSVLVDGTTVNFASLVDTSGSTFKYDNGGTAVFQPPADLIVSKVEVPAVIQANQPVDVAWEITNIGTGATNATWTDSIYISNDNVPGGDQLLGNLQTTASLASGQKVQFSTKVIVPPRFAGTRYFVVGANTTRSLFEGLNYTNNTNVSVAVTVIAPDLAVQAPSVQPASTQFGKPVTVSWTIRNLGTLGVTNGWADRLLLVRSAAEISGGLLLTNVPNLNALAPGASYNRTLSVTLPVPANFDDGNYFIAVQTDVFGSVAEITDTNNVALAPVSLVRPPLPDLAVDAVIAPPTLLPGQAVNLVWAVTNKGTALAEGVWAESVFLGGTNSSGTNQLIATFDFTNSLPVGSSILRTQQVVLPAEARAGSARLIVQLDAAGEIAEKVETNNFGSATITIAPVLTWNIPVVRVSESASDPHVAALLSRNGDPSAALTVSLASSDSKELTVPPSVTFRAGESSVPITLTVQHDGIPDGDKEVAVTASASGYQPSSAKITVLNSDKPTLHLQLAVSALIEGESTDLTVSHDGQFVVPITVNLSATGREIVLPAAVTIPPGQSSVTVEVGAVDNTLLEADRTYTLQAAAAGFNGATADLRVHDNDLNRFTLSVSSTNVSEGAGAQAAFATVSRGLASPRSLQIELENSNPEAITVPKSVLIAAGDDSVTFPVAVVNNSRVDGVRTAVLKAYALGSVSGERVAQSAPVVLNVGDDDGPTLTVTVSREILSGNSATVTVTRNTAPVQPLTVHLSSSIPGAASVPATLTIPQGATSATVELQSNPGTAHGNQSATITASAPGYTSGSATVIVTDLNKPDLIARELTVPDTAETEAFVNVGYRIYNQGLSSAGTNWVTKIYLSDDPVVGKDTLLNEYAFNGTLPVGQFFGQTRQVRMPQTPGQYWLIVQTDTEGQIDEIIENNNTSVSIQPVLVTTAYSATVVAEVKSAPAGASIPLHGTALKTSTGGPSPFALVNIHIDVKGTKRIISALADENGKFAAVFKPLPGEAGIYEIGAAQPGASTAPIQDSFTLFGLKAENLESVRVVEQGSNSVTFALRNLVDVPLTGLTLTAVEVPPNLQVTSSVSGGSVPALGTASATVTITAQDASVPEGTVRLRATTTEGATLLIEIPVTVDSVRPHLVVNPTELVRGMKVGGQTIVEFDVINDGGSASGPINVALPTEPWMHLVSVSPLPALPPHASNRVTLQLTPPAGLTLGAYEGRLALTSSNASILVPYTFRALSEAKGDLRITAVDEYTFFAEGSPKVSGAAVTIRDPVTLDVITNAVTDTSGNVLVRGLAEGYYQLDVRADKHSAFHEPHLILAGQTNQVQAFLRREAVRYIWKVIPTDIQDRTRITIETEFEAYVPMPVITVEPPLIDLADYTAEVTQLDMKVVNHGLIAAKDAKLTFEQHPEWSIEPLVEALGDIPARGSFTVPVIIRKLSPGAPRSFGRVHALSGGGGGCSFGGSCRFTVECGGSKLPGSSDVPVINASASGNCGGGGGGGMIGGGGTSGGGGGASQGGPADSSNSYGSCDACTLALFKCGISLAMPDIGSCLSDLYGCQGSIREGDAGQSAYNCMKAGINCMTAAGEEALGPAGKAMDIAECLNDIVPSCLGGGGGGGGGSSGGGGGGGGGTDTGLTATLKRQALRALAIQDFTQIKRGEFAIVFDRMEAVLDEISPLRYLLGDDIWFRSGEPDVAAAWLRAFVQRVEPGSESGGRVSATEAAQLLGVKLPRAISEEQARKFIDRWNRSLDYWAQGITTVAQVPTGQNRDFIALDTMRAYSTASHDAIQKSAAQGYGTPDVALTRAREELMQFMTEGGGGGVCAHVRLRLDQDAVLTRDAFNASLDIVNDSSDTLDQVRLNLEVHRRNGENATELFGIRPPVLQNLNAIDGTGVVSSNSTGTITWTLIPTTEIATNGPEEFLVSGTLQYVQNGQLSVTIPLAPASITVLPSPALHVKYFHERQVFADDPFTTEIEPSVPYSLAVMVQNNGRGVARNVHIDSAQPKIVENTKGLLADFKIIATQVEQDNLTPSLSVNFGQLNPGTNAIGRWLFTSTIMGGFIDYSATFEHLDDLGNKKLSLIDGVEIHELIHIVRAPGALDDGRPDFLVNDVADLYDRPDTLHLSDGSVQPVSVVLEGATDHGVSASALRVQLSAHLPPGFVYLRIADPGAGKFRLVKAVRDDGFEVPIGVNVWTTDRTFLGNARRPLVENVLHLFDYNSSGNYTLFYEPIPTGDQVAPSSAIAALPTESAALFPITWSGQDNQGGSGLSFYDVYVSVDNGPFQLWISQTIDRSAIFQGGVGRSYAFYSVATDQAGNREEAPLMPDARTILTRTNQAPTLELIADQVLRERGTLNIQPMASDPDGDELTFSLGTNAPPGTVINPYTGKITWVTSEGSGPKTYSFTVQVLDSGLPRLGATRSFKVTVTDENSPPVITPIGSRTINEGQTLTFTAVAEDIDLPSQAVSFSLAPGAPAGATINADSGLFTWKPNDFQGGVTYGIGIIARDDGTPSMSSTQTFNVTVRDTRSDLVVRLGTTNVLAGNAITVPISVTAGADLGGFDLELLADDGHLDSIQLAPAAEEVASASLEALGTNRYRVRIEFDPTRTLSGTRTVGTLQFATKASGRSAAAALSASALHATRQTGDRIANTTVASGRLFLIENEPLLDSAVQGAGGSLVLYAKPGSQLILQSSGELRKAGPWQDSSAVTMTGTFYSTNVPLTTGSPQFFRLMRVN